jgi:ferredoxin--NADP+ reductase
MQRLRTNFAYLPIISRPQDEPIPWTGAVGHVQDLWKDRALERIWNLCPKPENTHIFLCGSPDMIEEMVAMLVQEKFAEIREKKPGQIHVERYWPRKAVAAGANRAIK